ncbi:MAG: TlpA family protein disulfide reductase [Chitinophagaceae bacterium]|nr:MAG: TlpA family protein disulfide reductase [Chitinophagaceae bacterium]
MTFKPANGKEEKAVGLFTQTGNKLQGTFLRVTGDSRFLEGVIDGNKFELSSFIGSSPSYYKGSFDNDGNITGEIVGVRGNSAFTGVPDESAELPDPYKLTYLKEGYSTLDFTFPDIDGKPVSLKDEKFKNKVVIVTIGGTWCPNCMDETMFLAPWYKDNKQKGVEIISLQYERKDDPVFVKNALTKYRTKFGVEYTQLFAGIADKQAVASSLPALNTFLSFPTMILIDKQGKVTKIHTGFSGPATGKYYTEFVKEFNADMAQLLN